MKPRYFLIAALLCLIYGIYTYNQNGDTAAGLARQVTQADATGQSVSASLNQLETYVHKHVGATTSVFLSGSYDRAVAASQNANPTVDGSIYADAQTACAGHANSVVQAQCVTAYVTERLKAPAAATPAVPPTKANYTYRFGSPRWTADAPGLALLATVVLAVVAAALWLIPMSSSKRRSRR